MNEADIKALLDRRLSRERAKQLLIELVRVPSPQTALLEAALDLAEEVLAPGGAFVGKVFQGGATGTILPRIKQRFREQIHHDVMHDAPRADVSEQTAFIQLPASIGAYDR